MLPLSNKFGFHLPTGAAPVTFTREAQVAVIQDTGVDPWAAVPITVSADSDLIVVCAGTEGTDFTTAPTFNGALMTLLGSSQAASNRPLKFWYLTKTAAGGSWPGAGTANVVINPDGAVGGLGAAMIFKGAPQVAPQFYADPNDSTRTSCSVTTASLADSVLFIAALTNDSAVLGTQITAPTLTGEILRDSPDSVTFSMHVGYVDPAGAANVVCSADATGTTTWQTIAVAEVRAA